MLRSSFCSAALWGSLAVLAAAGNASAQWFPFGGGNNCGCGARPTLFGGAPIMQSASYSSYGAAYSPIHQSAYATSTVQSVQCGQPIACTIDTPVAAVHTQVRAVAAVQPMQQVIHPVYNTVHVTEYQPVKQKVSRPVYETKMVAQNVTVMQPVTTQQTANVPTVNYQTVTEYQKVQKQVGYWATKTEATNKITACQYDNRPGMVGWMNRTGHQIRNAFVPPTRTSRTFVPQTMTCTVPCTKTVAVPGMKQVTYNVTQMVPQQQTRQVAVNTVRYVEEEITAMQPVTVARTVQVGHRISYAPAGSVSGGSATATGPTPIGSGPTATGPSNNGPLSLNPTGPTPTPDAKASAKKPDQPKRTAGSADPFDPDPANDIKLNQNHSQPTEAPRSELADVVIPTRPAKGTGANVTTAKVPTAVRVTQWVAHQDTRQDKDVSIAGNSR